LVDEHSMSWGQKFWGVLVSPARTFKAIGEDPRVLTPAIILIVAFTLLSILIWPELKESIRATLLKSGTPLSPEKIAMGIQWALISTIIATLVMPPLMWVVHAALLTLFNQLSIGKAKFKQLFAVAVFAWTPVLIQGIIKNVLVKMVGAQGITTIKTSLGLFLPSAASSGILGKMADAMDLFVIWGLILLSIGGAVVMGKDSKKVGLYIFGLWLAFTGISVFLGMKYGNAAALG
jgi:hypothetical protein